MSDPENEFARPGQSRGQQPDEPEHRQIQEGQRQADRPRPQEDASFGEQGLEDEGRQIGGYDESISADAARPDSIEAQRPGQSAAADEDDDYLDDEVEPLDRPYVQGGEGAD